MSFAPGDEVVCIDAKGPITGNEIIPVEGRHYTIRECGFEVAGRPCCFLVEIVNAVRDYRVAGVDYPMECPWEERRFRRVRREAIEQFKRMCGSPKPLIPVDSDA